MEESRSLTVAAGSGSGLVVDVTGLIRLGYWLGDRAPGWPDPRRFVDPDWDADERAETVSYLRHAMVARAFMGHSQCRFCDAQVGSLELSDGVFIWPEGLAHYVEEHDVRLPERFVRHLRAMVEQLEDADVDDSWWHGLTSPG